MYLITAWYISPCLRCFRSATHFVQVERDIDDPLYVAVFLLVVNAAQGNYVIPGLVPPFFRRHYKCVVQLKHVSALTSHSSECSRESFRIWYRRFISPICQEQTSATCHLLLVNVRGLEFYSERDLTMKGPVIPLEKACGMLREAVQMSMTTDTAKFTRLISILQSSFQAIGKWAMSISIAYTLISKIQRQGEAASDVVRSIRNVALRLSFGPLPPCKEPCNLVHGSLL